MTFVMFLAVMLYLIPVLNFVLTEAQTLDDEEVDRTEKLQAYLVAFGWPLFMVIDIANHAYDSEHGVKAREWAASIFASRKDSE